MGHVVVGVVEVNAQIFSAQCEPSLSQTHLCMMLCVPTRFLWILCGDHISVHSLLLVRKNYRHVQYCSWCCVGKCANILSAMRTNSILNSSMNDPLCPNKCFMNSLRRSFFCSLIAISYKELHHTPWMGHVVVGVMEVGVHKFSPQCEPTVSQIHLCILFHFLTSVFQ